MSRVYEMLAWENVLVQEVYWESLGIPDFVGVASPYPPANLQDPRVFDIRVIDTASPEVEIGPYTCPPGALVGDCVYFSAGATIDQADDSTVGKAPAIGVIASKPTATTALVAIQGKVSLYAGLTPGAKYFLGASGAITNVVPTNKYVQVVGFAATATDLVLTLHEEKILN